MKTKIKTMKRRQIIDSRELMHRVDDILAAASNRYNITVQLAKRAKRSRYEEWEDLEHPMMKLTFHGIFCSSDRLLEAPFLPGLFSR